MDCLQCSACCQCLVLHLGGAIEGKFLEARDGKYIRGKLVFPLKCKHLDIATGKCDIYENRPESCKDFKVGCSDCLTARKWKGL